jgi:hypothetical protein
MAFELNDNELLLVKRLVRQRLSELNPEIQHTGSTALRDELRERQTRLQELYRKIQQVLPGDDD